MTEKFFFYRVVLMITIGILSDTHQNKLTDGFKKDIARIFASVEKIIHAGDITTLAVYEFLLNWELYAVRGNMDEYDLQQILPEKRIIEMGNKRIGIIHGRGAPNYIEDVVDAAFDDVDVIVYGHSHVPLFSKRSNAVLFNPGSYRSSYFHHGTAGIMTIDDEISFRHIKTH